VGKRFEFTVTKFIFVFGLEVISAEYILDNHSYIVSANRGEKKEKNIEIEFV
jgi:hypothetical protein